MVVHTQRRGWAERLTGAPAVVATSTAVTGRRLRVLAYHGIRDVEVFAAHLARIRTDWQPVSAADVVDAVDGGAPLPARAVWVTLDDGLPELFTDGLDLLNRYGIPATAFVCPGLIDGYEGHWWQVVEGAASRGAVEALGRTWTDAGQLIAALRRVSDDQRRAAVAAIPGKPRVDQPVVADLVRWTAAGHAIGNHTWDHPCLDRCTEAEVRAQITDAHRWLTGHGLLKPAVFAYPTGGPSEAAETTLGDLGYRVACRFDHRLADVSRRALRLSRLRIDADDPVRRLDAVLSGAHPAAVRAFAGFPG